MMLQPMSGGISMPWMQKHPLGSSGIQGCSWCVGEDLLVSEHLWYSQRRCCWRQGSAGAFPEVVHRELCHICRSTDV